jgi:hypothetical protein
LTSIEAYLRCKSWEVVLPAFEYLADTACPAGTGGMA